MIWRATPRTNANHDLHNAVFPTAVLDLGGMLSGTYPSTATGLGVPAKSHRSDLEMALVSAEAATNAASVMVEQSWTTYVSSTESGLTHLARPTSLHEEVNQLRDEILRRTRLTRQQIARSVGVDRRSLSSWVNGTSVPGAQRMERLRVLAELAREIDRSRPGLATEILLSRRRGRDLLDVIADGRFDLAQNWQSLDSGEPSVRVTVHAAPPEKPPLFAAALAAFREGRLSVPPRATRIRDTVEYEQDLAGAQEVFPEEDSTPKRRRYR